VTYTYSTSVTRWTNTDAPRTTNACDAIPRVSGQPATTITVTQYGKTMEKYLYTTSPAPTCTIANQAQCSIAYADFSSLSSSFLASVTSAARRRNTTAGSYWYFSRLKPPCTRDSDNSACPTTVAEDASTVNCHVQGNTPTVLYWPTTSVNLCDPDYVDPAPTATDVATKTAVFRGVTITSPTALVIVKSMALRSWSYSGIYTYSYNCGPSSIGPATFLVPPKDLSTVSWKPTYSYRTNSVAYTTITPSPVAMNLAHLESPPWSNYINNKRSCYLSYPRSLKDEVCDRTIYGDYSPTMMLPSQFTAVRGVPSGCRADATMYEAPTYVPITTDKVEMPATTNWGVTVSFGELSSSAGIPLKMLRPEQTSVPEPELKQTGEVEGEQQEGSPVQN